MLNDWLGQNKHEPFKYSIYSHKIYSDLMPISHLDIVVPRCKVYPSKKICLSLSYNLSIPSLEEVSIRVFLLRILQLFTLYRLLVIFLMIIADSLYWIVCGLFYTFYRYSSKIILRFLTQFQTYSTVRVVEVGILDLLDQ